MGLENLFDPICESQIFFFIEEQPEGTYYSLRSDPVPEIISTPL